MRQQIAGAMLALLGQHGWTQGCSMDEHGRICAVEALGRALAICGCSSETAMRTHCEMAKKSRELYPGRARRGDLVGFNDHKDTTEEDLVLVVKHWAEDQ